MFDNDDPVVLARARALWEAAGYTDEIDAALCGATFLSAAIREEYIEAALAAVYREGGDA